MLSSLCFTFVVAAASAQRRFGDADLHGRLQDIAHVVASKVASTYNCSVSIAFHSDRFATQGAAGVIDDEGTKAATTDAYAWGSVTKVITGASVLRLVSEGAFGLDDEVAQLVDPLLSEMARTNPGQGFASMADLFGAENVSGTTVRKLLSMTSSVPDFDTANPCGTDPHCVAKDPLRSRLYAEPDHAFSPLELMKVPWVAHRWKSCKSWKPKMQPFCYSSTNFMLLGLILAAQAGLRTWKDLDQAAFLIPELKKELQFALTGSPSDYSSVHGYDRTSYNQPAGTKNNHDNWKVDGVFSGWTASDVVAPTSTIAQLAWEVFGPPSSVAPPAYSAMMEPQGENFYGLATQNMRRWTGQNNTYGRAYGHLGATYGYQSILVYFPELKFTMAVATNIETDYQTQPAMAVCLAYNAVAGELLGQKINCTYEPKGYYSSGCKCTQIIPPSDAPLPLEFRV